MPKIIWDIPGSMPFCRNSFGLRPSVSVRAGEADVNPGQAPHVPALNVPWGEGVSDMEQARFPNISIDFLGSG